MTDPPNTPDPVRAQVPAGRFNVWRVVVIVALFAVIGVSGYAIKLELWPAQPIVNATPDDPVVLAPAGLRLVKDYYTVDDGATVFIDAARRLPPFDHEGKPAVRAVVFVCDVGKTRFVGYLKKLPEGALADQIAKAGGDANNVTEDAVARAAGWLVKKPGDSPWVNTLTDPAQATAVRRPTLPPGSKGKMFQAFPTPIKEFYTVDDGATLFAGDMETLPPFDHGGKPAVSAVTFTCDGGRTHFIGYLRKLPEDAIRDAVARAGGDAKKVDDDDVAKVAGWLVKKPGDAEWLNTLTDFEKAAAIRKPTPPPGSTGRPLRIYADYR